MMYSYGPPHMAEQKQEDLHEHTFSNYVRIRDVVQKTLPEAMNDREKWWEGGQGYPCYQHDMMMMYVEWVKRYVLFWYLLVCSLYITRMKKFKPL